jgi:hypothetical protein
MRAQLALSKSGNGLKEGVNTDALLDEVDRYDDCQIDATGAEKVSRAWAGLLLTERQNGEPAKRSLQRDRKLTGHHAQRQRAITGTLETLRKSER